MGKFKVKSFSNMGYYISNGSCTYLHSDGVTYPCIEYWPTKGHAQAVLDKYQPKRVWKHAEMSELHKTKAGVTICPFFAWTSEDVEGFGQSENDVNLTHCLHTDNPDAYEGNCQDRYCPLLRL